MARPSPSSTSSVRAQSAFTEHLNEVFRAFGAIDARRMFGGYGIYHQGIMIGLVTDDTLYLKTDADTLARFQAAGAEPFRYEKRGETVTTSYYSMPVDAFEDPDLARSWASVAYEAALRARQRAPKRKRKSAVADQAGFNTRS